MTSTMSAKIYDQTNQAHAEMLGLDVSDFEDPTRKLRLTGR